MPRLHLRRLSRRRWRRYARVVIVLLLVVWSIDLILLVRMLSAQSTSASPKLLQEEHLPSVFIASIRSKSPSADPKAWARAVESIAIHVGVEKAYISVYEEAVDQDHRDALDQLDRNLNLLGVRRSIVSADSSPTDLDHTWAAQGLLAPPKATSYVAHLANMRNRALKPMIELALQGVRFDRILFLEGVLFSWTDVLHLLSTRDGTFGAACALDFDDYGNVCDTLALRDSEGHGPVTSKFPYFRSPLSRIAAIAKAAIPVQSCWNGMVALDSKPFYRSVNPVAFRDISKTLGDMNLQASERCLVHADNPYNATEDHLGVWMPNTGIWLNPYVRVGCAKGSSTSWPSTITMILGIWRNRLWRWCTSTFYSDWIVQRRLRIWQTKYHGAVEPGLTCLLNKT